MSCTSGSGACGWRVEASTARGGASPSRPWWARTSELSVWPGPTSRKTRLGSSQQLLHAVAEAHRLAQVAHPVAGSVASSGRDPGAGEVGDPGRCGRAGARKAATGAELVQDRIEQAAEWAATVILSRLNSTPRARQDGLQGARPAPPPETTQASGPLTAARERLGAEERAQLLLGEADAEHHALRARARTARRAGRPATGRPQGHHAGQAGAGVLAQAVAGHGRRLDAPGLPQPGQGVLGDEDGREPGRGALQGPGGGLLLPRRGEQQGLQVAGGGGARGRRRQVSTASR